MPNDSDQRLQSEHVTLEKLRADSTILTFQAEGKPPTRYTITLRGHGACRAGSAQGGVEICTVHRIEVRLPYDYPAHPPDVRWLTPIMHPNISYSGIVNLKEIGVEWTPHITLDALCERLWDVARLAYINSSEPSNYAAQKWLGEQTQFAVPLDGRPLRDIIPSANPNIVRYARRDNQALALDETEPSTEVLFIGEDTPTPRLPGKRGNDEVFYIGDE